MKFTGQVRVPEVDHPGVPATIVVDGDQTEVFLEGESLGRWSLFDVRASRLVSSAFSVSLGEEEITFIADEPVDFAYKGVDHMAAVWARYKSMTIPRRVVAVGRSRRGTTPSRIPELREAMLQNLAAVGRVAGLRPIEVATEQPAEPSAWTKRIDAYSNIPEPLNLEERGPSLSGIDEPANPNPVEAPDRPVVEIVAADDRVAAIMQAPDPVEPAVAEDVAETDKTPAGEEGNASPKGPRVRPGPGLIRRPALGQSPFEEPAEFEAPQPEQVSAPPPGSPEEPKAGPMEFGLEAREEAAEDEFDAVEELSGPDAADQQLQAVEGEALEESLAADGETPEGPIEVKPVVVVDLGHLEDDGSGDEAEEDFGPPEDPGPEGEREPVFAGAPSASAEKSGLLGAVRSAFARKNTTHVHEFVEAPGGIGIVRQICSECGYISIGVSD